MIAATSQAFPALGHLSPNGHRLVYLDSAATALPLAVAIDAMTQTMTRATGAIHRSVNYLGDAATETYESARQTVAWFIGAEQNELVFTRNTTEALNLLARALPSSHYPHAIVSAADHHSSLLPWQRPTTRLQPDPDGRLDLDQLQRALAQHPRSIVSLSYVSNVLGTAIPCAEVAALVHATDSIFVLDAAQAVPHLPVDVLDLGCDALAFSGHKLGGPNGIGGLYASTTLLAQMEPVLLGGGMVEQVGDEGYSPKEPPWLFEAGTPAQVGAAGMAAAIRWLDKVGMANVQAHSLSLTTRAINALKDLPRVVVVGADLARASGVVTLAIPHQSPHRIARSLSEGYGVCVRSGVHCAEPLHRHLGHPATLRASFWVYNTPGDVDIFVEGLTELLRLAR